MYFNFLIYLLVPRIMVVHLKRFDNFSRKIKRFVKYEEHLDLSNYKNNSKKSEIYKYRLCSVLVHQGTSIDSGHYYSYVRVSNDQWYCFNDTSVVKVDKTKVLNQAPYLLFYEKVLGGNRITLKNKSSKVIRSKSLNNPEISAAQDTKTNNIINARSTRINNKDLTVNIKLDNKKTVNVSNIKPINRKINNVAEINKENKVIAKGRNTNNSLNNMLDIEMHNNTNSNNTKSNKAYSKNIQKKSNANIKNLKISNSSKQKQYDDNKRQTRSKTK